MNIRDNPESPPEPVQRPECGDTGPSHSSCGRTSDPALVTEHRRTPGKIRQQVTATVVTRAARPIEGRTPGKTRQRVTAAMMTRAARPIKGRTPGNTRQRVTAAVVTRAAGPTEGRTRWKTWQRVTAGVGAFGMVAAFVVAQPVAGAAAGVAGGENPAARMAVTELTGPQPANVALPADFPADRGYRPVKSGGLLVDPRGECSSPVRLPEEFRTACQAHDLGYDVLRYADDHGQPLGPWARQAIDAVLTQRMWAACEHRNGLSRSRCDTMAVVAGTAVDLNSRRQNYATPRPEYLFGTRLSGKHLGHQFLIIAAPAALVLSALALLLTELVRGSRRRKPNPADRAETTR